MPNAPASRVNAEKAVELEKIHVVLIDAVQRSDYFRWIG